MKEFNELLEYRAYYEYDFGCEAILVADGEQRDAAEKLYARVVEGYFLKKDGNRKWEFDIALDCVHKFTDEEIEHIRRQGKIKGYHFGYGMYVRNRYIYGSRLHRPLVPDGHSGMVATFIYMIVIPDWKIMPSKFFAEDDDSFEILGESPKAGEEILLTNAICATDMTNALKKQPEDSSEKTYLAGDNTVYALGGSITLPEEVPEGGGDETSGKTSGISIADQIDALIKMLEGGGEPVRDTGNTVDWCPADPVFDPDGAVISVNSDGAVDDHAATNLADTESDMPYVRGDGSIGYPDGWGTPAVPQRPLEGSTFVDAEGITLRVNGDGTISYPIPGEPSASSSPRTGGVDAEGITLRVNGDGTISYPIHGKSSADGEGISELGIPVLRYREPWSDHDMESSADGEGVTLRVNGDGTISYPIPGEPSASSSSRTGGFKPVKNCCDGGDDPA